eukprot:TRINITY_DN61414_c0_g1_i1.p1 TRINITY_DN61414_c0_g1~~TRINITY_DN61414_c0_g1_i1.p1  ORF type:complete len:800 (+),score=117.96 TRINITY_DN61414_c0_g1_i1:300-2699(+)
MAGNAAAKRSPSSSSRLPTQSPSAEEMSTHAAERQALLYRPAAGASAPNCERFLFCLTGRQLWDILMVLFILHLVMQGQFLEWAHSVVSTLFADVFYGLLFVLGFFLTSGAIAATKGSTMCGIACDLLYVVFTSTLAWFSLLRISQLHELDVRCLFCKDDSTMHLDTFRHFVTCWTWMPVGLARCFAGVWWRPWWFVFHVVPLAFQGRGPLSSVGDGLPWWQCREMIIGFVWQPSMLVLGLLCRSIDENNGWVVVLTISGSTLLAAIPFYLTTDPCVVFWCFLADPWEKMFGVSFSPGRKGGMDDICFEEWVCVCIMLWWATRVIYVAASMRFEEWNARKRVEEGLRYALEHPFKAELEHGFGTRVTDPVLGDLEQGNADGRFASAAAIASGNIAQERDSNAPDVVDFKTKRDNLMEVCKARRGSAVASPHLLCFTVRRSHLLEDTWRMLSEKPVTELLAPSMFVSFEDERGSDSGGVTRDWFDSVAHALVDGSDNVKGNSLLAEAPDRTLVPRPIGRNYDDLSPEAQEKFRSLLAIGRFLALAVHWGQPLPLSFSTVACKHILGVPVGMIDVMRLDPDFYRSRVQSVLLNLAGLEAALGESLVFTSAPTELQPDPHELKPNGANIVVTENNKVEYVQLLCEAYLCGGNRREIQCMLQGFWDLLPMELLRQCQVAPAELSLHISGVRSLDADEWRSHSREIGGEGSQVFGWFWEVVSELAEEHRCMLLHFATGSSRLPPAGFADLDPAFSVMISPPGTPERLPVAHTCSNYLVLQEYLSKEQLREKLLIALATESFELA